MKGKIFNDSANIYQDQAKVLYEYYKAAAEKIVNEEKALEEKIQSNEYQIQKYNTELNKTKIARTIALIFFWTLIGLIIALIKNARIKEFQKLIAQTQEEISKLQKAHKEIFRDYRVTKMGVAYVPVAKRVAYNGKSFIVDQSGLTPKETFTLQVINQKDLINNAISDLHDLLQRAPIVEKSTAPEQINTGELSKSIQKINFNDYFGKLDRTLRTISYSLENIEEYNVALPVVFPNTAYARFLDEHATSQVENAPVFHVFDTSRFNNDIDRFNELNETRKALSNQSEKVDDTLKSLMVAMANAVQATALKKINSAGTLVDYTNRILFNILKAPYNFYSPVLEAEEIERIRNEKFDYESIDYNYRPFNLRDSSRVKLDLHSMSWVAEDGSRTTLPFGVNQIQYEIIAPIVSNLLKDTKKERLEIYNHIKDQKISYLNKWHQDTEDFYGRNRAEAADIINLMRSTLAEYSAAYNTLVSYKKTEKTMQDTHSLNSAISEASDNSAEILAGYQVQAQQISQVQEEFSNYMARLHDDIDTRAEKFGYVEYYDASLRDKQARDTAVAADRVDQLEERRKPLAEVNPLLAQNFELPPEPNIDPEAFEYAGINLTSAAQEALSELTRTEAEGFTLPPEPEDKHEDVQKDDFLGENAEKSESKPTSETSLSSESNDDESDEEYNASDKDNESDESDNGNKESE